MQKTSESQLRLYWAAIRRRLWQAVIGVWASRAGLRAVPTSVDAREVVARAILTPYHLNKQRTKLTRLAFEAPFGVDEVSVRRTAFVSLHLAKGWAKAFAQRKNAQPAKLYVGMAFISVSDVQRLGSAVVDSRGEYLGHADICHGVIRVRNQPLPAQLRKALDQRLDDMASAAKYVADRAPSSYLWRGPRG